LLKGIAQKVLLLHSLKLKRVWLRAMVLPNCHVKSLPLRDRTRYGNAHKSRLFELYRVGRKAILGLMVMREDHIPLQQV